jgi:uncharacterized protein YodC (DUF2158 family)
MWTVFGVFIMRKSNTAFSIGQIVRVKSGGPDMTIKSIDGDAVLVEWDGCEGQNTTFNSCMLVSVSQTPPPNPQSQQLLDFITYPHRGEG